MSKPRQFRMKTGFLKEKRRKRIMESLRKEYPTVWERDWAYFSNTRHKHKPRDYGIKTRREIRSNQYLKEIKKGNETTDL
jgi:hypothetical protein